MIAIIDYGMGNIHSVRKALQLYGAKTKVTNNPQDIKKCAKLVLPGVGAFDDAVRELKRKKLIPAIKEHIKRKKPFLGICLGMQLLFDKSTEAKKEMGLGIFKGNVKKFANIKSLKVPHMGWNQLGQNSSECPLLNGVPRNSYVYFCHSYYPNPANKKNIAAVTKYGLSFSSVVWQENIYGVQFHPEKSQETGLRMIKNFVRLC